MSISPAVHVPTGGTRVDGLPTRLDESVLTVGRLILEIYVDIANLDGSGLEREELNWLNVNEGVHERKIVGLD